jgi:transglutaminase-like putative cysteine protease
MLPGQLLIIRRGAIVWNSMPGTDQPLVNRGPQMPAPPNQPIQPAQPALDINPIQAEQAQQTQQLQPHQSIVNIRSITHTDDGRMLAYRMFDISHTTEYSYTDPVQHSTHTFRLQPVEDPTQEVVSAVVTISTEGEEIRYEDVFGNESLYYSINKPYKNLSIKCESRVKVFATPPDDHSLSQRQSNIPLVWMPWARQMMTPYLLPEELPETQLRELTDYAMSFVERNGYHLMETLKDMNLTIYRDYKYVSGSTSLSTTPFDVYTKRQGVCQDFANLLICLARLLSIPARYRMGYIYTGMNYENKVQSDASHAWLEIYLPYVGWRGFDPTNGCMVAQDHIRVACGRNYRDATPTSGTIFKGGGGETIRVDVKTREVVV